LDFSIARSYLRILDHVLAVQLIGTAKSDKIASAFKIIVCY